MAVGVPAGAAPVQAAAEPLRLAVSATYRIDPAGHAVHVALDITATNNKPNTATTIYWYDRLFFGVQAEARNFVAASGGSRLGVTLSGKATARRATVRIPNLYHGQTRRVRLTFDLPGGKPRSKSPIRVGPGHVEFTAWAWGQSGLGTVTLVLPKGYTGRVVSEASDGGGHLSVPDPARPVWKATKLGDPVRWYAVFSADRADALKTRQLELDERVYVRAWPEDGAWLNHVSDVLTTGFPALRYSKNLTGLVASVSGVR
jgi:catechol 2,3-dioxygenase-like lactoylglutathione lyase family enzyme